MEALIIVAPLLVPPFVMAGLIALRSSARMEKFPTQCVLVAMWLGYLSSIASFLLSLEQWRCPAGFWYDKTIWPALIAPALITLVLAFAIARAFGFAFPRKIFVATCVFSHAHLTAYYLWWFSLASPDLFKKALSFRSVLALFHM